MRHAILELRAQRSLGPKALQAELRRQQHLHLSTATIWKVLSNHDAPRPNGKVERSQQTGLREFRPTVDLADPALPLRIEE